VILASAKELYGMFLESVWWQRLSWKKRQQVGKCERCGSRRRLQAHHRIYRENWFDTTLEDLECVCRKCHEKEHGITPQKKLKAVAGEFKTLKELEHARAHKRIDRGTFKRIRDANGWMIRGKPKVRYPRQAKKHRPDGWKKHYRLNEYGIYVPRIMTRSRRWKNFGRSSN